MIRIFCDGGSRGNPGPAAAAFVVKKGKEVLHQEGLYIGKQTNNVAEYAAVLMAHEWIENNADMVRGEKVEIVLDSELVTKQMKGEYKIKNKTLATYATRIKRISRETGVRVEYRHVLRDKNVVADGLVNEALDEAVEMFT